MSWYDAMAFCRWLSQRHGSEIRLPLEWEWQQAATGGRAENLYPWGTKWDGGRANTKESHLNRTVAVGLYPHGASAQQVMDLSGNVWEWCLNGYDEPKSHDITRKVRRVLRGGSWDYDPAPASTTSRKHSSPDSRSNRIGFRVVCVS